MGINKPKVNRKLPAAVRTYVFSMRGAMNSLRVMGGCG
jgi:hypothetical protein